MQNYLQIPILECGKFFVIAANMLECSLAVHAGYLAIGMQEQAHFRDKASRHVGMIQQTYVPMPGTLMTSDDKRIATDTTLIARHRYCRAVPHSACKPRTAWLAPTRSGGWIAAPQLWRCLRVITSCRVA